MNSQSAEPTSSVSESVEVLESLDFIPGCEWEHPDQSLCDSDAAWLGIFTCCDDSWQVCNLHQVQSEVNIATGYKFHIRCGKETYMDWLSLY